MLYLLYLPNEIVNLSLKVLDENLITNFTKIAKIKRISKNRNFRKICSRAKNRKISPELDCIHSFIH